MGTLEKAARQKGIYFYGEAKKLVLVWFLLILQSHKRKRRRTSTKLSSKPCVGHCARSNLDFEMKKGIHPQRQWISYVTQSGRLINVMMTKIHQVGKVYHIRGRQERTEGIGQIAKFKRRYEQQKVEETEEK
ncbi:uncharacterized protein [Coffea arabica]|uniref:Uncharacterized protein isoform X2 n=1 Tax=Coffea arabica TaxID=13443 RepID=A0ABM4UJV8_COFAR